VSPDEHPKYKTVTISLPTQLVAKLDRVHQRDHRTRSEILREAVYVGESIQLLAVWQ
jgi:metal-responsive CopG/Arc/MetJ family transcriptional regulator